jgi:HlyD family secretion protein
MEYNRLSHFPQRKAMTMDRIARHEQQYTTLQNQQQLTIRQHALNQSQFSRDSLLYSRQVISTEEMERAHSAYLQSHLSIENMRSSLGGMRIQITQLQESLLDMYWQDTERSNDLRSRIRSLTTQLQAEIQSWEMRYVLQSPINGTITFTGLWVENQNVQAGETVFTVVPGGAYEIMGKAQLPIARSGTVEVGQNVNVRLHNFPENHFGILRGEVSNISLVPFQVGEMAYYMVIISLPEQLTTTFRKELPWLPNMQGQADIITEDISLLGRFIAPLRRVLSERR